MELDAEKMIDYGGLQCVPTSCSTSEIPNSIVI